MASIKKGVCVGKKHGQANRQRGIHTTRSSFSPTETVYSNNTAVRKTETGVVKAAV
jgi:hypothetical protein